MEKQSRLSRGRFLLAIGLLLVRTPTERISVTAHWHFVPAVELTSRTSTPCQLVVDVLITTPSSRRAILPLPSCFEVLEGVA